MQKDFHRYLQPILLMLPLWGVACAPPTSPAEDAGSPAADAGVRPPTGGGSGGDAGVPNSDAGTTSDGGSTPGNDGGSPSTNYGNEDCSNAESIEANSTIRASTAGADDDHTGSCGGSGGPDLVYRVTLDEPSGLIVQAAGYDMVMYVTQNGCAANNELEDACVDDISDEEYLAFELLPAGDYNIIIDTYVGFDETGDAFSLSVEVYPGGYCTGDDFDPADGDPAEPTWLGSGDIDTQNLDPEAEESVSLEWVLCADDADFFAFGHMGGELSVELTPLSVAGSLQAELFAVDIEEGQSPTLGEKIQDLPLEPNAIFDRGLYYLKITGEGVAPTGDTYGLKLEHACQPDAWDSASPYADDNELDRARLMYNRRPSRPVERTLCGDDVDMMRLTIAYPLDLKIDLLGGSALNYEIFEILEEDGAETLSAYTGVVNPTTSGTDVRLLLSDVPENTNLLVKTFLDANAPFTPVEYRVDLLFGDPPINGDCSSAESLSVSAASPTVGSTINGQSTLIGPCNGEEQATGDGEPGTADVFYTFTVPGDYDTDIFFNGNLDPESPELSFEGSVYLFQYPGSCPNSLAELTPVLVDPSDETSDTVCDTGVDFRIRIPQMTAGEYLMVVDGAYRSSFFGSPTRTVGRFEIDVKTYPEGFPPPAACVEATEAVLPGRGASVSVELDTSTGTNEFTGLDYGCFFGGGNGKEHVVRFTPSENVVVDIETTAEFDTMLMLREAVCSVGDADVACNDDGGEGSLSLISGQALTANTEYFLFVDGYFSYSDGPVTVTIRVRNSSAMSP